MNGYSDNRDMREFVTLEQVVSNDYNLYGNSEKKCTCPSCHHEKSFCISTRKNIGKCFRCGFAAGNSVSYYKQTRNLNWKEAQEELRKLY